MGRVCNRGKLGDWRPESIIESLGENEVGDMKRQIEEGEERTEEQVKIRKKIRKQSQKRAWGPKEKNKSDNKFVVLGE